MARSVQLHRDHTGRDFSDYGCFVGWARQINMEYYDARFIHALEMGSVLV